MNRYNRQIILKNFGEAAQQKLLQARLLVIGAGGLGCPALQYLAGAGVGTVGIMDGDIVTLSNLHRQILFFTDDIGKNKAVLAAKKLSALNPEITIYSYPEMMDATNALDIISQYDIVIDGTDNFSSRYLINDACVLAGKPLVYAAVSQYEGQVAVLNVEDKDGVKLHYRDLFPNRPVAGEIANCAEAGVLGVLPGIIGTMQAAEAIKLITGIGNILINRLLTYSVLTQDTYIIDLEKNVEADRQLPADANNFKYHDYGNVCANPVTAIDQQCFDRLRETATIVDVREYGEQPEITAFPYLQIPLSCLQERLAEISGVNIIFLCLSGVRSQKAAAIYSQSAPNTSQKLYSLQGGILSLNNY